MKKHTPKSTHPKDLAETLSEALRDLEALDAKIEAHVAETYTEARKILAKLYKSEALAKASREARLNFAKRFLRRLEALRIESDKHALDFGDFFTSEAQKPFPEIAEEEEKEFEALTAEFSRKLTEEEAKPFHFRGEEGASLKEQEESKGKHLEDFLAHVERLAGKAENKKAEKLLRDFLRYMNEKAL